MKKILELNSHSIYYDNKVDGKFNNNDLKNLCDLNLLINKKHTSGSPGEQTFFHITNENFTNFKSTIIKKIYKFLNLNDTENIFLFDWVYRSTANNIKTNYHTHDSGFNTEQINYFKPTHTLTYYISMPENDNGLLWFRDSGKEISFQPNIGDLLIFPANLEHKPDLNLNSNISRVVYAANFCKIDEIKIVNKTKQTLI